LQIDADAGQAEPFRDVAADPAQRGQQQHVGVAGGRGQRLGRRSGVRGQCPVHGERHPCRAPATVGLDPDGQFLPGVDRQPVEAQAAAGHVRLEQPVCGDRDPMPLGPQQNTQPGERRHVTSAADRRDQYPHRFTSRPRPSAIATVTGLREATGRRAV
jgi:hypothetical protein